MKDYMAMFNEAMDVVHGLGIETGYITNVSLNYRAKNRFGQCRRNNVSDTYSLNFNHLIFDDKADEDAVMSVLIHEILHTCKDCMTHKGEWKRLANIVNANTKYNITRCTNYASQKKSICPFQLETEPDSWLRSERFDTTKPLGRLVRVGCRHHCLCASRLSRS